MDRIGDFRLLKKLAAGGMGEVYLAEKVGPGGFVKHVVLKCILGDLAKDDAFLQLFLSEANLSALLNHPNIAQVYDFGAADGVYYIAMEHVVGYTLEELAKKHRSMDRAMPVEHVACVGSQLAQGLRYAHTRTDAAGVPLGLVHRDVSPQNVMVTLDGTAKLLDFGIAKVRRGLASVETTGRVGKLGYAAPEQANDEPVDARADVFSVGVCLWELLANQRLADPRAPDAPDYRRFPPPHLADHRASVPPELADIVARALEVDPARRTPTAQTLHLELERFLTSRTHYAGPAALASYLADLAAGRVEQGKSSAWPSLPEPHSEKRTGATELVLPTAAAPLELEAPRPTPRSTAPPPRPTPAKRAPPIGLAVVALAVVGAIGIGLAWLRESASGGAAPKAPSTVVEITSTPSDAELFVDGQLRGRTPSRVELMPGIVHPIELRHPNAGTRRARLEGQVSPGPRRLHYALAPRGTLDVTSEPPGRPVSLDGVPIPGCVTPCALTDVEAGRPLKVSLSTPDGRALVQTVEVPPGGRRGLSFVVD